MCTYKNTKSFLCLQWASQKINKVASLAKFHFSDIVNFYRISKYNIKAYSVVSGVVLSVVLQTKWIHAE